MQLTDWLTHHWEWAAPATALTALSGLLARWKRAGLWRKTVLFLQPYKTIAELQNQVASLNRELDGERRARATAEKIRDNSLATLDVLMQAAAKVEAATAQGLIHISPPSSPAPSNSPASSSVSPTKPSEPPLTP